MNRCAIVSLLAVATMMAPARATVIINEVLANPPGSAADDTKEYIELLGTPGKKLDGFAIASISGTLTKYYTLNSITPVNLPNPGPEIDEFFSLDGLELGPNGILVIGIGQTFEYGALLPDANFQRWNTLWNGGLDTTGKLENDGSKTIMLVRNRPGRTPADPDNPIGLRWGKDIQIDTELVTPIETTVCSGGIAPGRPCRDSADCPGGGTCVDGEADQFGNGNIDRGDPNNMGGFTLDLKGATTTESVLDDLEIVDEVSYEHERGWEYDQDERDVDTGSPSVGLKPRNVHALGDPQGLNPDALTRVDYRTMGDGWTPAPGATGALPNGNNWQDTATEQWIRGETVLMLSVGQGAGPWYGFDNGSNLNVDAIQPYFTQVPTWLADGSGTDYNFGADYQLMPGRINPLAVPFIPGDSDRDGDCDADDIAKLAAVFGDDNWVFSNSFEAAPESDDGDPALQTRPWDVDATGDNGIEASDLQWALNFQGDATGQVIGRQYDSTTPSAAGVYLNPNTGVVVTLTAEVSVLSGRSITGLLVGDMVELVISAQVTGGANVAAAQQNGVMQFVHDIAVNVGGVARVVSVEKLGAFATTRAALETAQGTSGDLGMTLINGHTTQFTAGLGSPAPLYRVMIEAIGEGEASVTITPAAAAKFAASTPEGVKVGHTSSHGDPESSVYPAPVELAVSAATTGACCLGGDCSETEADACTGFVCDAAAYLPASFTGCHGDADGNGIVNAADRGFVSANVGGTSAEAVCLYDMDGNGVVNAADRGFISANIGGCSPLPDYMNGSGLNGGAPDARFDQATFHGVGSSCGTVICP